MSVLGLSEGSPAQEVRRVKAELRRRIGDLRTVPPDMLHRFAWMELFERYEAELERQEDLKDEEKASELHASKQAAAALLEDMSRVSRELMAYDAAVKRTTARGKSKDADSGVSQGFALLKNRIDANPRPPAKGEPKYVKHRQAEA